MEKKETTNWGDSSLVVNKKEIEKKERRPQARCMETDSCQFIHHGDGGAVTTRQCGPFGDLSPTWVSSSSSFEKRRSDDRKERRIENGPKNAFLLVTWS